MNPATFIGRAPEQVKQFLELELEPALQQYVGQLDKEGHLEI